MGTLVRMVVFLSACPAMDVAVEHGQQIGRRPPESSSRDDDDDDDDDDADEGCRER